MKTIARLLSVATCLAMLLVGCSISPEARIVRMNIDANSNFWQYSVNGHREITISSSSLTNKLSHLNLHHGDVILFGMNPLQIHGPARVTWDWILRYGGSNQVATYHYLVPAEGGIFSVPVYHWVTPFNNPRTLAKAAFFCEGELLAGC